MSSSASANTSITKKISFDILSYIRGSRDEHGLRHGDYLNYRRYCTRRLHRMRRASKLTLGKGRFQQKEVNVAHVMNDLRALHIVVVCAERAWAMAMQKKSDNEDSDNTYNTMKKMHMKRRLSKAVRYAKKVVALCAEVGDDVTNRHAQAYAAHMEAYVHLENEAFSDARAQLVAARALYLSMAQDTGISEGSRKLCRTVAEEIEPNIRYAHLRLGGSDGAELDKLLSSSVSALSSMLSSLQINKPQVSEKTESMDNIVFRQTVVPVGKAPKLREAIFSLRSSFAGLSESSTVNALEEFTSTASSAVGILKSSAQHVTGQQFHACEALLKFFSLQGTLLRNYSLIRGFSGSTFEDFVAQTLSSFGVLPSLSSSVATTAAERSARAMKLLQTSATLVDEAIRGVEFISQDPDLVKLLSFQAQLCDIERFVFSCDHALLTGLQWQESMAFVEAAGQLLSARQPSDFTVNDPDLGRVTQFATEQHSRLASKLQKRRVQLQALYDLSTNASSIVSNENAPFIVSEHLNEFPPSLGNIVAADLPPKPRPLPVRPVFFDLAAETVTYPDFSQQVAALPKKESKPAASGGLFGFWRRG